MRHQRWILLLSLFVASHGATYYVATNGSNSAGGTSTAPFATFAKAFGVMAGGDTLMIKDGVYTERMTGMPSGTSQHYTNIRSEHNFRVSVRAGNALYISGKSYIRVEGIKFDGNLTDGDCADIVSSDHIKIIRCSFTGSEARSANWNIVTFAVTAGCSYVLVEECWAWGTGRYKFLSYTSNNVIFRRCVARHDYHPSTQCACFHRYSSTNVEFQNCIALDCGLESGLNGHFYGGVYNDNHDPAVENTGKNLGCILLNLGAGCPIYDIRIWGTRTIEHCVVWDCANGIDLSNYKDGVTPFSPANTYVNHCTLGSLSDSGFAGGYGIFDEMAPYGKPMDHTSATNSIITKTSLALDCITASDYNCFHGNSTNYVNTPAGSHDTMGNPGLLYITRAAPGAGNASDGGFRGATVEKRYGAEENLWGEEGYEALTDVNLWPWPNEAEIKTDMSSWNAQMSDGDFISDFAYRDGAGIYIAAGAHECILNNIIRNNTSPNRGAGIFINDDSGFVIKGNLIDSNIAYGDHGAGVFLGAWGYTTENIIQNNRFSDPKGSNWAGGVILLGKHYFSYTIVRDNQSGKYVGVYTDEGSESWIDHCLIYRNQARIGGAGMGVDEAGNPCAPSRAHISNCTVANNHTEDYYGSGIYSADSWTEIKNCIFWGNTGGSQEIYTASEECNAAQSYLSVTYTLSTVKQPGVGNISADPLFADSAKGDFHLKSTYGRWNPTTASWVTDAFTSPAIDAGDPSDDYSSEPAPDGGRINLGAYGGTPKASKSDGDAQIGCGSLDWIAKSMFTVRCSSNPARSSVIIYYQLPRPAGVRLEAYSQNGKRVADIENGFRSAGPHRVTWKTRQPAGHYIIKLTAGEYRAVRTVAIKK